MTGTAPVALAGPRQLRPYQQEAVNAVLSDWTQGTMRVGVVLPTGAGKSTVIGKLASTAYDAGMRIVLLAHRGELLDQMVRDLKAVAPHIPADHIGIVRAERDEHDAPIVAATLQTLAHARRRRAVGERQVILWDEVHHAGAEGFHETFSELNGYDGAFMCGFTATMRRDTQGLKLGEVIQKVSYEKDLRWAIEQGFLIRPYGLTVRIENLNALNDVRTVAGDFQQNELAEVMEAATEYVGDAVALHAAQRHSIVFAAGVDAAQLIADELSGRGMSAEAVTGSMSLVERQPVYDRFRSGETQHLVTVQVLTEGADFPMCDCVVLARPTRSKVLYSQMVGRALRLYEGKDDALVLDLSGTTRTMKLVTLTDLDSTLKSSEVNEDGEVLDPEDFEPYEEPEKPIKVVRQGPVDMVSIDLLTSDETDVLWLQTPGGVPFVPLRDNLVGFLWPLDDATFAPGYINTRTRAGGWVDAQSNEDGTYAGEPMSAAHAVDVVETWVLRDTDHTLPVRSASWRRSAPPSEAQLNIARRLGVVEAADMTKARLSDEISIAFAARVLDPR